MIFGDEKRFSKQLVASSGDRQVYGVASPATDSNIGPGAYYNSGQNEKRNGWQSRSFNKKSPMSSPSKVSRESYIGGVITPYGTLAPPPSPKDRISVGPGHYDSNVLNSFSKQKSNRQGPESPRKDTTPRFAFSQSSILKDGVLFQSRENDSKPLGPGYYSVPLENTLLKPSFNVRASNQPNSPSAGSVGRANSFSSLSPRPRSSSSGPRLGSKRV